MIRAPRTVFWRLVLLCLVIRLALEVLGLASIAAHGQPVWTNVLDLWNRWDAPHYLRVAEVGYRTGTPPPDDPLFIVFFPLFPLAVRIVAVVVRNLVLSGLLVSFAASVGAAWFLYRLVELDRGADEAWRTVLLLMTFPTAYFLAAPYSEALFLFAVVASIYAARTNRWIGAGLAGALATGTRVTGVALAPALLAEALRGRVPTSERIRRLAWVVLSAAGLVAYLAINHVVHGDAFWFLEVQRSHWFQKAIPPWQSIVDGVTALLNGVGDPTGRFIYIGRIAAFVFAVPVLVLAIRRVRVANSLYAWSGFLLILSASWLISLPRYLLVLYPIFMVEARFTSSKRVLAPVLATGALLQGWLFWRYAVGAWTF